MITFYLTSIGVIPLFVSRAFLPIFSGALVARFAQGSSSLAEFKGIQLLSDLPAWATSDMTLIILGIISALEILMAKSPEFRELMVFTDAQLKGIGAFLVCFLLVEGDPADLLRHLREQGLSTDYTWGQSIAYTWSFVVGYVVWSGARLRRYIFEFLLEADQDDSIGLQRLLSWLEDGIGFFGVLFVVLLPSAALIVAGLSLLSLFALQRTVRAREERSKVPCPECGTPNHLCGIECSACRQRLPSPRQVGLLGTARKDIVEDFGAHHLQMVAQKRCPSCGKRLRERLVDQRCPACDTATFADVEAFDAYLASVRDRLPRTLAVSAALSFIPVLGLIPGIIYYRLSLIAGLRNYLPRSVSMLSRWFVRILSLLLLGLQPVPLLGAATLPLMCYTNYLVYRSILQRQRTRIPATVTAGQEEQLLDQSRGQASG